MWLPKNETERALAEAVERGDSANLPVEAVGRVVGGELVVVEDRVLTSPT